jgi:polyhydroxyalkanoate synthesis regulator phasin
MTGRHLPALTGDPAGEQALPGSSTEKAWLAPLLILLTHCVSVPRRHASGKWLYNQIKGNTPMRESEKAGKVPEFLRESLESAQERLEALESDAQRLLKDLVQKGRESRKEIADVVQRLSKQDWKMEELRGRFGRLRAQGKERAHELRGKAEGFRADAMERLEELQSKAITFLGVASREQVEELSAELERLARRLDRPQKAAAEKKPAPKKAAKRSAKG